MEIIKELRDEAGISQRKLGALIGRDRSYIGKIESGKHFPDFATILDIIQELGGDPGEVVNQVVAEAKKKKR